MRIFIFICIRMPFLRELVVCFLDLSRLGIFRDTQNGVRVLCLSSLCSRGRVELTLMEPLQLAAN
jgi:hypothetical protein